MSLPIVEGCRAVIVNSVAGNNGKEVVVMKFYGSFALGDTWVINITVPDEHGNDANVVYELQLKRIPDKEETTTWQSIETLCNWRPTRETASNE